MMLKDIFGAKLQLKLLSLFFATVLWLFVTLETNDETDMPLAVKYVNLSPGSTLQGGGITQLTVRVAGPRTLLLRQKRLGARVELDLSGIKAGRVTFSGLGSHVRLIPGVRPLGVNPASLEVVLVRE